MKSHCCWSTARGQRSSRGTGPETCHRIPSVTCHHTMQFMLCSHCLQRFSHSDIFALGWLDSVSSGVISKNCCLSIDCSNLRSAQTLSEVRFVYVFKWQHWYDVSPVVTTTAFFTNNQHKTKLILFCYYLDYIADFRMTLVLSKQTQYQFTSCRLCVHALPVVHVFVAISLILHKTRWAR